MEELDPGGACAFIDSQRFMSERSSSSRPTNDVSPPAAIAAWNRPRTPLGRITL
jgi:hypothetical protein